MKGWIIPALDSLWRVLAYASPYKWAKRRWPGSHGAAEIIVVVLLVLPIAALALPLDSTSPGWRCALAIANVWILSVTVHRSLEAAILEPYRDPGRLRSSHSRSFLLVVAAYLTVLAAFALAYRLHGGQSSVLDAIESSIQYGTLLGNNNPTNDKTTRSLRLLESLIGLMYLGIMIGRFSGAFSKEQGVPVRLLAVCGGNTCRSPVLALLLRRELEKLGIGAVDIISAGADEPFQSSVNHGGRLNAFALEALSQTIHGEACSDTEQTMDAAKGHIRRELSRFAGQRFDLVVFVRDKYEGSLARHGIIAGRAHTANVPDQGYDAWERAGFPQTLDGDATGSVVAAYREQTERLKDCAEHLAATVIPLLIARRYAGRSGHH